MADRHPLGRTCRDPLVLLAVLLLMPYALMRHAVATLRPTRTPADSELDLPPCDRAWPGQCHPGLRHRCWTWTGWPHICRCLRCEVSRG